uniref:Uncharacterized protein n=1 Tax=Solanum lycopersicum TaxID=4081 RepID=A0A3Q7JBJ7_SOLLC
MSICCRYPGLQQMVFPSSSENSDM